MPPAECSHRLNFFGHDFEIFGDLHHKWYNLFDFSNVLHFVNIPECSLAELVGDEELVEKNVSREFFTKEYLYLVVRLIIVLATGNLIYRILLPRLRFLAV